MAKTEQKPRRDREGRLTPEAMEQDIKAGGTVQTRDEQGNRTLIRSVDDIPGRKAKAADSGGTKK